MTNAKLIGQVRLFRPELSCTAGACVVLAELLASDFLHRALFLLFVRRYSGF